MRIFIAVPSLLLLLTFVSTAGANAKEQTAEPTAEPVQGRVVITPELVEAHIAYKAAQARVRNYQHVVLPNTRRRLDEQVRLAETEIAILHRRLRDYRPFLRVGEYSPVRTAAESHLLSLRAAESRLRQLKDDRIALMRSTRQQYDFQNLEIVRAAAHYAQVRRQLQEDAARD